LPPLKPMVQLHHGVPAWHYNIALL
jgi:hypothetical protein